MSGSQQLLLGGSVQQAVDPFFYSVTSLLHGDGTNGGQNNTFLDSSTNNFTITRNGNTTQGSFSPFSQTGWGLYQPAVPSDYLNFTTSAGTLFQFTGDYTIEAWVFPTVLGSDTSIWVTNDGSANYHAFNIDATNYNIYLNSGSPTSSFSHGLQVNQWNHVAMVRNGSTITVYTNGVSRGTITNSSTNGYSSPTLARIGGGAAGSSRYLSNLRIVKGTAVYTAAFTPPTTPLTAISGTSLLTCQANRFLDASSNALVATVTGSPSVQPFSPFNPITPYSTSAVGGSGYFDGSGDYLDAGTNAALGFGTGDFTVEAWIYRSASGAFPIYTNGPTSSGSFALYVQSDKIQTDYYGGTSLAGTTTIPLNSWNHVAVIRSGSTLSLYLNGSRDATTTTSSNNTTSNGVIGREWTNNSVYSNGYISSVRVVKGTAVYTGTTYTVPTAPLTAIANTSLLCNFTNGAIFDNAADADYETVGNAQISTSVKKYGTGSIAFDGSGDRLVAAPIQTRAPGTGDFCYEFWFYANTSSNACLFDTRAVNNNTTGFACLLNGSSQIALYTNTTILTCGLALSASTWYHIAVTRTAGVIKVFVNGTVVGTLANTSNFSDRTLQLGQYIDSTGSLSGYIDDFRSSNGVGRYAYNFTPPTAEFPNIGGTVTLTADPYFDYTTLLLPGNGTNGAQNNTFLDSSTNNFTITRNGNTTQGTFSPFSQTGWGNYFDGTGDYLSLNGGTPLSFGTGDFTIEGWYYFASTSANLIDFRPSGGNGAYPALYITSGSLRYYVNSADRITSGSTLVANTWYHIAISRSGSSTRMFVNGTQEGSTYSDSTDYTVGTNRPVIGVSAFDVASNFFSGYMSNIRAVKGTAVYTANFTPSTTPLTAITNTSLLTCQSNRFIDNSTNNFAITRNGDVSVQAFSPFNPTAAWSAATNGGSGYFDGSGDYLSLPINSAFSLGTGDCCIEAWIYTSSTAGQMIYDTRDGSFGNPSVAFEITASQVLSFFSGNFSPASAVISGGTVPLGAWTHVAITRSSGTNSLYINGTRVATNTTAWNQSGTATSNWIGAADSSGSFRYFNGYISNFRIVKGSAVYTGATITVPTAPLTAITNTSLLTNFTNAGIYDATSKNDLETGGTAQISTTQSKFGGSSIYLNGSSALAAPTKPDLNFGTGDFTVEFWINASASGSYTQVVGTLLSGTEDGTWRVGNRFNSTNAIYFARGNGSGFDEFNTAVNVNDGVWHHMAMTRQNGTCRLFVDGILAASATIAGNCTSSNPLSIGYNQRDNTYVTGYIDDLRITKGIARYTSNFTPPTTAFLTL